MLDMLTPLRDSVGLGMRGCGVRDMSDFDNALSHGDDLCCLLLHLNAGVQ